HRDGAAEGAGGVDLDRQRPNVERGGFGDDLTAVGNDDAVVHARVEFVSAIDEERVGVGAGDGAGVDEGLAVATPLIHRRMGEANVDAEGGGLALIDDGVLRV